MKPTTQQLLDILRDVPRDGMGSERDAVLAELGVETAAPIRTFSLRLTREMIAHRLLSMAGMPIGKLRKFASGAWMMPPYASRARLRTRQQVFGQSMHVIYVRQDGAGDDDAGDGSRNNPYATIERAQNDIPLIVPPNTHYVIYGGSRPYNPDLVDPLVLLPDPGDE